MTNKLQTEEKYRLKAVNYSYPTSGNARRFGFPHGCYTVSTHEVYGALPVAVAAFPTVTEAFRHANGLPGDYLWDDQARFAREVQP